MSSSFESISCAVGQRSMGDASKLFPLLPVLLKGCPASSDDAMQYPLEIDYDYSRIPRSLFDQAPLAGLDRWAPILPPLAPGISLGEGGTPLIEAPRIAQAIGLKAPLLLKDESRNPTWSHKDRLNLCTVSAAIAAGARGIAAASSGNHGAAAAAYAARMGLPCVIVTSRGGQPAFRSLLDALGAHQVVVERERRWPVLQRIIDHTGFFPVSNLTRYHTGNPYGPEGYKTIAYEIFLQMGRALPGAVVVPTGYGELLYGLAKGFWELQHLGITERVPRILSAEPQARGPLARALKSNAAAMEVEAKPTIASGIGCTVSSFRGVQAIRNSLGNALTCSDASLRAMRDLLSRQGIFQEYSGVAGLAALQESLARGEPIEGPVVAILTSSGLKDIAASEDGISFTDESNLDALLEKLGPAR
ncbi:pyridoxal-phosphate dependent enzyme [Ferrovibrio sp.]|uniref:threonine synthase n=1 Tax=Ferrovibrio sp. TaxID=1917215 RepID=UPI0025C3C3F8|nr:pyridoxal-phosphate dependent enzyme [Ferrovibrio sp.]MBX3456452.1 pyridoxal-phosphate dependent enzyme [Ferrovibrio sp.]